MLTKINSDGTWSCSGINMTQTDIDGNLYGALCKLRDYEKSGFEPDDLERVNENIHIGSIVQRYTVFGVWNDCCIAENPNAPAPFVVWKIDRDGFGVRSGRYFNTIEAAQQCFAETAFTSTPSKKNYWKR